MRVMINSPVVKVFPESLLGLVSCVWDSEVVNRPHVGILKEGKVKKGWRGKGSEVPGLVLTEGKVKNGRVIYRIER
jgi:hypothetical protein